MPEHVGGSLWTLGKDEYVIVGEKIAIVGPATIRVQEYGIDPVIQKYIFTIQLYRYFELFGNTNNFPDLVMQGQLPSDFEAVNPLTS
ncbi:MAG: hypothetical protein AAB697_03410 [Patescibacteria group bacterium]